MKFVFTITVEQKIDPNTLKEYYDADTLEEAVKNQQGWIDDGSLDPYDLLGSDNVKITVAGEA